MNKFQRERKSMFDGRKLSDERKHVVIEMVHAQTRRKKQWIPAVVVTCGLIIGSFLLLAPEQPSDVTEVNQAFTTKSLAESFESEWHVENMEVLFEQTPFLTNNDSLIIVKESIDGEVFYHYVHGKIEKDKWSIEEQAMIFDNYSLRWETISIENQPFKIGLVEDPAIDNIFVGNEQATMVKASEGVYVWIGASHSRDTPVYKEVKGKLQRLASYRTYRTNSSVHVIEPIGANDSITYKRDTMTRGNDEYRKFPIVLDPYYYAENAYQAGDAIAYERNGQLEVTRILSAKDSLQLVDDSFVFEVNNEQVFDNFYYWPTYDGHTGIYKSLTEKYASLTPDEVFVSPDNWASNGYRGPLPKEKIVGKVLGYDLNHITNTMTQTDYNRYEAVQEIIRKMKANDSQRNALDEFLKDARPQIIAQIYYYASYRKDFETMYALLAQQTNAPLPYEEWMIKQKDKATTNSIQQNHLVKIYYVNHSKMNQKGTQLEWRDENSDELLFKLPMVKENGGWKVVYSTITDNLN